MKHTAAVLTICIEHHDKARNRNLGFTSAREFLHVTD